MRSTLNYCFNLAALALGRRPVRPLLFSYYVTHRCALACRYCGDGDGRPFKENKVAELATDDAKRLIAIMRGACDTLDLTGGEPLLRPDLEELICHAQSLGMRTVLNTKGIGLEQRPDLMRTDTLVIGIDALDPAVLAAICGCGPDMARGILDGLEYAVAHQRARRTRVVLSSVAMPDNLPGVADVLAYAVRHGLGFHVSPQLEGVRVHPALKGNGDYRRLIGEVTARKMEGNGVLGVKAYLDGIGEFRPYACHPGLMPVIQPDGCLAYPCLERPQALVNLLQAGSYVASLRRAEGICRSKPGCAEGCQIFCHMALSLFQRHPLQALREGRHWASTMGR